MEDAEGDPPIAGFFREGGHQGRATDGSSWAGDTYGHTTPQRLIYVRLVLEILSVASPCSDALSNRYRTGHSTEIEDEDENPLLTSHHSLLTSHLQSVS